jgi:hypothetical protein
MIHRRAAVESLVAESAVNPGFATAHECLETFFQSSDADGPRRALAFRTGSSASGNEEDQRVLEVMTTAGKILLEGVESV